MRRSCFPLTITACPRNLVLFILWGAI